MARYQAHLITGGRVEIDLDSAHPCALAEVVELGHGWLLDSHGVLVNMAHVVTLTPVHADVGSDGADAAMRRVHRLLTQRESADDAEDDLPTPAEGDKLAKLAMHLSEIAGCQIHPAAYPFANRAKFPNLPAPRRPDPSSA